MVVMESGWGTESRGFESRLVMGPGQIFVAWVGSGQPSLVWKISL